MRNKKRIAPFVQKLQKYWEEKIPDWRFGQFMSNFLGFAWKEKNRDIFFIEDDEMSELLDQYFTENR